MLREICKGICIISLLASWCSFLCAQEDFTYASEEEQQEVFKFAWDLPYYGDTYPFAKRFTEFELNSAGEAYAGYRYGRTEDNQDSNAILGFAAFRPFVLDYGEDFAMAFGISYFGFFKKTGVKDNFLEGSFIIADDVTADVAAETDDIERYSTLHAVGFSSLLNFPTLALQIHFQLGYARSRIDVDVDTVDLDGLVVVDAGEFGKIQIPTRGAFRNFEFEQKDDNIFVGLSIRKFYDRDFFNRFVLSFSGRYVVNTVFRESKATAILNEFGEEVNLNFGEIDLADIGLDPQPEDDEFHSTVVALDINLATIHLPFSVLGKDDIKLGAVGAVDHRTGELLGRDLHGHGLTAGAKVSIFGLLGVIYKHTWENRNDQDDGWTITVAVGLYGSRGNTDVTSETEGIAPPRFDVQ